MADSTRWRIGVDARSPAIGAAGAFARVVDWEDTPPLPVPGLVRVLSSWIWQEGRDTRWWLGAVVEAPSAAAAAQRAASVVTERTGGMRTGAVTVHAMASAVSADEELELEAEEALDNHSMPGSSAPCVVPVRARAYARTGNRLSLEWISGHDPLAQVTVELAESLVIGLFEHRPPRTGPAATTAELLLRMQRRVVIEVDNTSVGLPLLDRYSGEYLSEGNVYSDEDPIKPHIYVPARSGGV